MGTAARPNIGPPQGEAELEALARILSTSLGGELGGWNEWLATEPPDRLRVVRRRGRVAGGLRYYHMGQWFGGRSVPTTGIAGVGISPEHRAAGTASSLMRAALEELHAMGVPISTLYPATQPLYRRAGYEQAGSWIRYSLPVRSIDVRDRSLDLRPVGEDDHERLRAAYSERARRTSGNLDRSPVMWDRVLTARTETVHSYIVENGRDVEGYVVFTQRRNPSSHRYDILLRDLVALTPGAGRRLLTFFADHRSLAADVRWRAGPVEPLLLLLREQEWEVGNNLAWMLRLVDVRGALAARGYPAGLDAELHLEVRDDVLPWNDGRFTLEVAGGKARVRKGGRGRLRIDVRGLASLYTGYLSAAELVAVGHAEGAERDLAAAQRVFAGPAPWMPEMF